MKYIEKSDNVEKVYYVYYDKKKLKELLDKIVRNVSYKTDCRFNATYQYDLDEVLTTNKTLPNGDPKFENKRIVSSSSSEGLFYNYKRSAVIQCTKVTSPELAYIIEEILLGDPTSLYEFLKYETSDELVPIDEKIAAANKVVDEIDNFDFDRKIEAIKRLKKIYNVKKEKKYFDTELLKQYYLQAYSLFELELISEKTIKKNSGRVLLKDYKIPRK